MFVTVCSPCLPRLLSFTVYLRSTSQCLLLYGFLFTENVEEDIKPYELLSDGEKTIQNPNTLLQQVALMRKDWISAATSANTGAKGWKQVLRDTLEGLSKLILLALPGCCFAQCEQALVSFHTSPSFSASGICTQINLISTSFKLLATVHAGVHSSVMMAWIICGWPEWSCALQAPEHSTKITQSWQP